MHVNNWKNYAIDLKTNLTRHKKSEFSFLLNNIGWFFYYSNSFTVLLITVLLHHKIIIFATAMKVMIVIYVWESKKQNYFAKLNRYYTENPYWYDYSWGMKLAGLRSLRWRQVKRSRSDWLARPCGEIFLQFPNLECSIHLPTVQLLNSAYLYSAASSNSCSCVTPSHLCLFMLERHFLSTVPRETCTGILVENNTNQL